MLPEELARFETIEFLKEEAEEAEAERIAALRKPIGRPIGWRADLGLTYAQFTERNGGSPTPQQTDKSINTSPNEKFRHRKRGRPRKQGLPSFNGPQPLLQQSMDKDSSGVEHLEALPKPKAKRGRPRVYSMVAAAGIGVGSSGSDDTSQDQLPCQSYDGRVGAIAQPKVVIPFRTNHGQPFAKVGEHSESVTRRRCQRCKIQRQRCDGGRPCQRCHRAGINAGGCIHADGVRGTHRIKRSASATTSLKSPSDEYVTGSVDKGTLMEKFQSTDSPSQRTSSPDSVPSGRKITIRRYPPVQSPVALDEHFQPAGSPSPETSSSDPLAWARRIEVEQNDPTERPVAGFERFQPSNLSSQRTSPSDSIMSTRKVTDGHFVVAGPSKTPQKAAARPSSLTPYYPSPSQRSNIKKSARRTEKEAKKSRIEGRTLDFNTINMHIAAINDRSPLNSKAAQTNLAMGSSPSIRAPSQNGSNSYLQDEDSDVTNSP